MDEITTSMEQMKEKYTTLKFLTLTPGILLSQSSQHWNYFYVDSKDQTQVLMSL